MANEKSLFLETSLLLDLPPPERVNPANVASSRRDDLQVIRGLAIISLVTFHFFPDVAPDGYLGVDQSFVLSGFLMAFIFGSEQLTFSSCGQFYYRRIKRILPLYWLIILLGVVLTYLVLPEELGRVQMTSTKNALYLITNIVPEPTVNQYFFVLQSASDMLTHTWSLCVEMQFYLLVPLIFGVGNFCKRISGNFGRFLFLLAIAGISFRYQVTAPSSTAFNGTLFRLWQFFTGIAAYHVVEYISNAQNNANEKIIKTLSFWNLFATICITCGPFKIHATIARFLVTTMTAIFIVSNSLRQELLPMNKAIVYIGDISFSWYLFHWPIYCLVEMCFPKDNFALIVGFVVSFLIAILVFETYEKFYLTLDKPKISYLLLALFAMIAIGIMQYNRGENKEKAMHLNEAFDTYSFPLLSSPNCIPQDTSGLCKFKNSDSGSQGSYRSMLIGNSYACNVAETFNKHISKVSNETYSFCQYGCAVLTKTCDAIYKQYMDVTRLIAPDILFITVRHMNTVDLEEINGDIKNDKVTNDALERLQEYERVVKKKIYILDSMPQLQVCYVKRLNQHLKDGTPYHASEFLDPRAHYKSGQLRLREIVRRCSKCELFTYMDHLVDKNGEMELVREDNKIALWSIGVHLTPAGLDRISPVYEGIAKSLANETDLSTTAGPVEAEARLDVNQSTPFLDYFSWRYLILLLCCIGIFRIPPDGCRFVRSP